MRKLYLSFCLLLAVALPAAAQTYNVTLQVDMNNEAIVDDTISVAGNFQAAAGFPSDWSPGDTRLTDGNLDSIYDITVQLPAGSYEFKYLNGATWGTDESVPGGCQVNGNRGITVTGDTTLPPVCFGSCIACPTNVDTVDVTFEVDMRNEIINPTVSIAGDFQDDVPGMGWSDWTPGATVMSDGNMDSIYTLTVRLPEGTYAYKYVNGTAWGDDESVPSGCAVNNNRELVVTGPGPITIPVHCYGTCSACTQPLPAVNVTFRVDMNNEIVNSTGIYVSGSFQMPAWVKDTLLMLDPDMDGIYEFTESIIPAEYQFKYYNGDGGDPDGETHNFEMDGCGATNGVGGWNRILDINGQLTDTILPIWEYNSCLVTPTAVETGLGYAFEVYPNPFGNSAIVRLARQDNSAYTLRIVSITGQVVLEKQDLTDNRIEISREGLNAGLYFVEIQDFEGRTATKKVIVQ